MTGMREILKGGLKLDDIEKASPVPAPKRATTVPGQLLERQIGGIAQENDQLRAQLEALTTELEIDKIDPNPHQPRLEFDQEKIDELAASIAEDRLRQPIIVRPSSTVGRYILVAGERRLRAVKQLGRVRIPALIDADLDEKRAAIFSTVENLQRKDLCDYECFKAFEVMLKAEWATSQNDIAKKLGISRSLVGFVFAYGRLPGAVLEILNSRPSLFGAKTAQGLCSLISQGGATKDLVCEAVQRLASGDITSEAATIDWVRKRLRSSEPRSVTTFQNSSGRAVFRVARSDRQLTVSLDKAFKPDHLAKVEAKINSLLKEEAGEVRDE